MPQSLTISSDNKEYLDFQELREAGIRYVGKLSGKIWTDHNLHDPGITILEMLCYALTDLNYRTSFDIKDLLAHRVNDQKEDNFFTAGQILGCNPLTPTDYRKLLIDIDGVRNAWLERVLEPGIAIQKENDTSAPENTDSTTDNWVLVVDLYENKLKVVAREKLESTYYYREVKIDGLYRVYLELENIRPTGSLGPGSSPITRETVLHQVQQTLKEHRNFGEDFLDILVLQDEKIGICADLELAPDANPDEVLQDVYSKIQEFLSPTVRFYTLEQMLERKKSPDEIFEGRPLTPNSHGFIDTDELLGLQQRKAIYTSDLYQVVLSDSRIRAIRNLKLSSFRIDENGNEIQISGKEWILELHPEAYRPVFSPDDSSIVFYKGPIPLQSDATLAKEVFENRLYNFQKVLLQPSELDLPIPEGTFYPLDDYYSIQHEFPQVYGIGVGGLAQSASLKRKAQARQLQAYLTFFDQLLANYLTQLANIRALFSFSSANGPQRTYFSQPLLDTPLKEEIIRFYNNPDQEIVIDPGFYYKPNKDVAANPTIPGSTIAQSPYITGSPEAREELVRLSIGAIRDKIAQYCVFPDSPNGTELKYRYLIKINKCPDEPYAQGFYQTVSASKYLSDMPNLASEMPLLVSTRKFVSEQEASKEAQALLLMEIRDDHFRRIDEDVLQDDGTYIHAHSFKLLFQPDDYLRSLQAMAEDETRYLNRRNIFLDHLLGRFSEEFTDYVLLMYALDGKRRAEPVIVQDKERFLQNYPRISENRGRGFDYTDLRLADTCHPDPVVPPLPAELSESPTQRGDYRYQFVDMETLQVLFVSQRKDYTRTDAEAESGAILKALGSTDNNSKYKIPNPGEFGQTQCQVIFRQIEWEIQPAEQTGRKKRKKSTQSTSQISGEIIAVSPLPAAESLPKEQLLSQFQQGKIACQLKQDDNTSGLERRVAALMGLDSWQRRDIGFLETRFKKRRIYGFQVIDKSSEKILLRSRQKDYKKSEARSECRSMIRQLKTDWDNPDYQVRPLPYGFQTTEYVNSIGVVKNPDEDATLIAVCPDTFGTPESRDEYLNTIRQAIESGEAVCQLVRSRSVPFFTLKNEASEDILLGLIDRQKVEDLIAVPANKMTNAQAPTPNPEPDPAQRLEEELNEFLRLLGSDKVEFQFLVDFYEKEYYDFQVIHRDYHVAIHPRIFQHKSAREKARDALYNYVKGKNDQDLFTEIKFQVEKDTQQQDQPDNSEGDPYILKIIDTHASTGGKEGMWVHAKYFQDLTAAEGFYNANFFAIIEAAREYDSYEIKEGNAGGYRIFLNVPTGQNGTILQLKHPHRFTNRDDAWRRADQLRQRARLYPVFRQDKAYRFFLYSNTPPPDFGTDWEREKRRKVWNFNWEDNILWTSVRTFSTPEAALLAFRGSPVPTDTSAQSARSTKPHLKMEIVDEPAGDFTFLDLIFTNSNYERMEVDDVQGSRDDLGPFNLEIIDPSKIVAVTPPVYRRVSDRKEAFQEVESYLFREGFHVIEHILLRPAVRTANTACFTPLKEKSQESVNAFLSQWQICPGVELKDLPLAEGAYLPLTDPFSSWATIVLPFWPKRFQNMNFRRFFEDTLRRETPAHMALRIAWVAPKDLNKFEEAYKNWLVALATGTGDLLALRDQLTQILINLKNVYPDANFPSGTSESDAEGGLVLDFTKLI